MRRRSSPRLILWSTSNVISGEPGLTGRAGSCGYAPPLVCANGFKNGSGTILTMTGSPLLALASSASVEMISCTILLSRGTGCERRGTTWCTSLGIKFE